MDSVDIVSQYLTLIFVILLNSGMAAFLYSEYKRAKHDFVGFALLAHTCIVFWHFIAVAVTINPDLPASLPIANTVVLIAASLYLQSILRATTIRQPPWLVPLAGFTIASLLVMWAFFPLGSRFLIWFISSTVLLVTAWITLRYAQFKHKVVIATLQLAVMLCYGIGISLLLFTQPALGGLSYFFLGILIPAISILLIQESVERSTQRIAESEKLHRELLDSVRDIFFRTNSGGEIEVISSSVQQIGFNSAELLGQSLRSLYVDDSIFDTHLETIKEKEFSRVISLDVKTREGLSRECELSTNCIRSRRGKVESIVGTIRDVSERNQLERQFIDAQRRESLGTMAGGVAHDFNNLLQAIVGRIDWLIAKPKLNEQERYSHLSVMLDASNTAARLCKQLLQYTGKAQFSIQPLSVQAEINDVAEIVRFWLPSTIQLEIGNSEPDIVIDADLTQIRQVFLNLIRNAVDSCADSKTSSLVTVSVSKRFLLEEKLRGARIEGTKLVDGEYACIEIRDNGCGIENSIIDNIFDPFYSTKHGGHGLGLASIVGILRQHNGSIIVESTLGEGSLFTVVLPISDAVHISPPQVHNMPVNGGDKTILLADDEEDIRLVASLTLKDNGYRVIVAADGQQALDLFKLHKANISAILLDVKMPNMDGIRAASEIRKLSPAVPIVLASGNLDISGRLSQHEIDTLKFLDKPYRSSEILKALQEACSEAVNTERPGREKLRGYAKTA